MDVLHRSCSNKEWLISIELLRYSVTSTMSVRGAWKLGSAGDVALTGERDIEGSVSLRHRFVDFLVFYWSSQKPVCSA